jgi:hypothetical protein
VARIRTIKPEFPQSESMGRVSREARLTFVLLWTLADDAGRLRGNSRMLASLLFPYDDDAADLIDGWLEELRREGCITRYLADGGAYVQIDNWLEHQKIDRPSTSKIPEPDAASRTLAKPREPSSLDQGPKDQGSKDREPPADFAKEFEEGFWKVYPKKVDRGHALKAYIGARKRGVSAETLTAGAERYRDDPKRDPKFTKNAQGWLTGECWNDQAAEPPPAPAELSAEQKEANRLSTLVWAIERRMINVANNYPASDVRKLIAAGRVTQEQVQAAGLSA